jgi:cobalamin-dependent methionine synthase I
MFLTIGERLNATRKSVAKALAKRDAAFVRDEIDKQITGGASIIDLNGGTSPDQEPGNLAWLAETAAAHCDVPICIDSANPEVIEAAIEALLKARKASAPDAFEIQPGLPWLMINSITADKECYEVLLPLVKKYNCAVIAMCLGAGGADAGVDARITNGADLVARMISDGVAVERIFIDSLVMPLGVDGQNAKATASVIKELKRRYPGLRAACGLSNISLGLPARSLLNRTFLAMLIGAGLDAAIMDTSDAGMMSSLWAALALNGKDDYCADFIKAFRQGTLTK